MSQEEEHEENPDLEVEVLPVDYHHSIEGIDLERYLPNSDFCMSYDSSSNLEHPSKLDLAWEKDVYRLEHHESPYGDKISLEDAQGRYEVNSDSYDKSCLVGNGLDLHDEFDRE